MHSALRYAMAWSLLLAMIVAVGCGSDGDKSSETEPDPGAQQPAASGEGTSASTPSEQAPGSRTPDPPGKPRVLIETNLGSITVELEPEKAPNTATNFLGYVRAGHYDNTIFHEVMRDHVVIGGSFTADLQEKSAAQGAIYNEARNGMSNVRETIAMSRQPDNKNSATCQFFFNLADNSGLLDHKESPTGETADQDFGYCVFGRVVEGMTVVDSIGNVKVQARGGFETIPVEDVIIRSVRELR